MATSDAPGDTITNPETGEPLDLESAKLVTLTGNKLTVYLPEEMEWYKGPDGERRAREIGGNAVNFSQGLYPPGDQDLTYEEAKLLVQHDHYGELFKLAAQEIDVESSGRVEAEEGETAPTPELAEDEVMLNGEIMTKEQAAKRLSGEHDKIEDAGGANIGDVPTESQNSDLEVLTEPNSRTEALEALAERDVDMSDAPPANATTGEIQEFAVAHGYVIEKYDLPGE